MSSVDNLNPWEHPEIRLANKWQYLAGYALTLVLLGGSALLVTHHAFSPVAVLSIVAVVALLAVMAQLILLFHLDFSETQRWNSLTLMLNVPLLILSVGITSWMFQELYTHVMMPGMTPPSLLSPKTAPGPAMPGMGRDGLFPH